MKAIRTIVANEDIVDLQGKTIRKGLTLHVIKEGPKSPRDGHRVLVVRVDNGTGDLSLMPETAIQMP